MHTRAFDINVTPDKRSIFLEYEQDIADSIKKCLQDILAPTMASLHLESISQWLTTAPLKNMKTERVETLDGETKSQEFRETSPLGPSLSASEGSVSPPTSSSWETPVFHHGWESLQAQQTPSPSETLILSPDCSQPLVMDAVGMLSYGRKRQESNASSYGLKDRNMENLPLMKKLRLQTLYPEKVDAECTQAAILPVSPSNFVLEEETRLFLSPETEAWAHEKSEAVSVPTESLRIPPSHGTQQSFPDDQSQKEACGIASRGILGKIFIKAMKLTVPTPINGGVHTVTIPPTNHRGSDWHQESLPLVSFHENSDEQFCFKQHLFRKMAICGQFNRGFVITCIRLCMEEPLEVARACTIPAERGDTHDQPNKFALSLFIVDQHAADEKARFEALNRDSSIALQPLLHPIKLELMPSQESIVEAHRHLFRKNGFIIHFDKSEVSGRRVRLMSLPAAIQGITLGESDFLALVHYLEENPFFPSNSIVDANASHVEQLEAYPDSHSVMKQERVDSTKNPADNASQSYCHRPLGSPNVSLSMPRATLTTKAEEATILSNVSESCISSLDSSFSSHGNDPGTPPPLGERFKGADNSNNENECSSDASNSLLTCTLLMPSSNPVGMGSMSAVSAHAPLPVQSSLEITGSNSPFDSTSTNAKLSISSGSTTNVEKLGETECLWLHSGGIPRPPRIWSILASKACRSAVMIGDVLDERQMANVVHKLSDLDQPWNCPHGRPTMRHLITLRQEDTLLFSNSILPPPLDGPLQLNLTPAELEFMAKLP
ncbi:Dna mismatch repair protein, C-terminal domain-containing protein [Cardiosporidium cionae]|uniref:Dna mismatch repair protein, C-terminal domain-containing protein n=1 Tax=Cardiosporidium cionae TaxID=476202 RepID=A0ABQ7J6U0_9APIC|nr:Dna mismatch repair protein, C-terminal domain-containing protein [Cardiosporidium cionae]|eukprot:KAF8819699.1 Dna mismatch repair protein, C-terminal domain-containing protein [Cardiosporidium cionae]